MPKLVVHQQHYFPPYLLKALVLPLRWLYVPQQYLWRLIRVPNLYCTISVGFSSVGNIVDEKRRDQAKRLNNFQCAVECRPAVHRRLQGLALACGQHLRGEAAQKRISHATIDRSFLAGSDSLRVADLFCRDDCRRFSNFCSASSMSV